MIASGSSPVQPPGFAFKHPRILDSDEILQLDRLPRSLAVVGAGVIGSEYACTFAALGTGVWVIDGRDELMPFLDREVSHALADAMNRQARYRVSLEESASLLAQLRLLVTLPLSLTPAVGFALMPYLWQRVEPATPPP